MRGERTPLSNGLWFGLVAGLFGGSIWALFAFTVPDEDAAAFRWTMIGGAFLFWFLVGLLVGTINALRTADHITSQGWKRNSRFVKTLTAFSWFIYRMLVGWSVGIVATAVYALAGFTLWFVVVRLILKLDKDQLNESLVSLLLSSMGTGLYSCFSGAVFGALFDSRWSSFPQSSIGSRAIRSSFLSLLLGVILGPSLGWLPPAELNIWVYLAASLPIGILAGILGGLWTDIRNLRRTDQLMVPDKRTLSQHAVDDLARADG